jgi:ferric-dicitrate binding protein FerR (iron transport regulator)
MDYNNYTVEDFVLDQEFRDWVLNPQPGRITPWGSAAYNPLMNKCLNEAREIILSSQPKDYYVENEDINESFLTIKEQYQEVTQNANSKSSVSFRVLKIAVIAIIFLLIGTFKQVNYLPEQVSYASNKRHPEEIILPEGSKVILAEGAELTFNENWRTEGKRVAKLKGQGYFSIKKRHYQGEKTPFIVQTTNLMVEVLGTEFNVKTKGDITQVVLNSGKVRLTTQETNQQLVMQPGDVVEYFHNFQKLVIKSDVDHEKYISWAKPIIQRSNTSLPKANQSEKALASKDLPKFGSYYNYSIKNAIANMPVFIRPNLPKSANNIIYQEQKGNNNSYNAIQHGRKNLATSISEGKGNITQIEQKGSNNQIDGLELHTLPEFGIVQYGNFNQLKIKQDGIFNKIQAHQYGNQNKAEVNQFGNKNKNITEQIGNQNKAYVKQIGDNLTSKQLQVGNQNKAEVEFKGNNYRTQQDEAAWSSYQEQVGSYNKSMLLIRNSSPNTNAYTLQHGQNNEIKSELSENYNYLYILQQGNENIATSETSEGDWNEIYIYQTGEQNKVGEIWSKGIKQKGELNDANILQIGNKNRARTSQTGVNNQVRIKQTDNK